MQANKQLSSHRTRERLASVRYGLYVFLKLMGAAPHLIRKEAKAIGHRTGGQNNIISNGKEAKSRSRQGLPGKEDLLLTLITQRRCPLHPVLLRVASNRAKISRRKTAALGRYLIPSRKKSVRTSI